ncbi:hypothetical protein CDL12_27434 [Handroanthus impetiginosus]|uniref:Uncharacterized protein n=1 Tax=Handroanthus impetiginosus TaxID=429701 RepID=A0A2G9G424_9LAMI|nr:hypothetical protein CDL12_27434 [Handroanthus impetiginosus]
MEGEADLPAPLAEAKFFEANLSRPINVNPDSISLSHSFSATSTYSSTTSSSSSSPPDLVRNVQAAFKRHRSLGTMQSNGIRPRRCLVPHREASKDSNTKPYVTFDAKNRKEDVSQAHGLRVSGSQSINMASVAGENPEDASMSLPSELGSTRNTLEENFKLLNAQRDQPGISARSGSNDIVVVETGNVLAELQKKVHFTTENNATSRSKLT